MGRERGSYLCECPCLKRSSCSSGEFWLRDSAETSSHRCSCNLCSKIVSASSLGGNPCSKMASIREWSWWWERQHLHHDWWLLWHSLQQNGECRWAGSMVGAWQHHHYVGHDWIHMCLDRIWWFEMRGYEEDHCCKNITWILTENSHRSLIVGSSIGNFSRQIQRCGQFGLKTSTRQWVSSTGSNFRTSLWTCS